MFSSVRPIIPTIDLIIVAAYTISMMIIGFLLSRWATRSTTEYFLSGRNLPWWLLGTSMVATTFAADTPLAVSGLVIKRGIAGNWYWWAVGLQAMLGTFLFAHLWRRSSVLTDTEFIELRYSGRGAAVLRAFRAVYFSLIYNTIVMGWVNLAMAKILYESFHFSKLLSVGICFVITVIYTSLAGLWGVVITDFLQFVIAMISAILLAIISVTKAGGIPAILNKLAEIYTPQKAEGIISFFPTDAALLPVGFFLIYIGLQWWTTGNTDGGGYFAQRILSAKNEKQAWLGFFWGTVAHYCLRPWPWIIVGLVAGITYYARDPQTGQVIDKLTGAAADPERGYIRVMIDFLPSGLLGVMLASFVAAYMSTIDTQLNWGASYLINDFYRRFLVKDKDERHYVKASIFATLLIALCGAGMTLLMSSIVGAWELLTAINAGIGVVYLLRWYWWRINAYSELAAMLTSLATASVLYIFTKVRFPISLLYSVPISSAVWIAVTLLTPPVEEKKLITFYERVRPGGPGWKVIMNKIAGAEKDKFPKERLHGFILGVIGLYSALFGVGKLLFGNFYEGIFLLLISVGAGYLIFNIRHNNYTG